MGEWSNRHNRKRNPFGGKKYTEDLEEILQRNDSAGCDEDLERELREAMAGIRCYCCGEWFSKELRVFVKAGVCWRCRNHVKCGECGRSFVPGRASRGGKCPSCVSDDPKPVRARDCPRRKPDKAARRRQ